MNVHREISVFSIEAFTTTTSFQLATLYMEIEHIKSLLRCAAAKIIIATFYIPAQQILNIKNDP